MTGRHHYSEGMQAMPTAQDIAREVYAKFLAEGVLPAYVVGAMGQDGGVPAPRADQLTESGHRVPAAGEPITAQRLADLLGVTVWTIYRHAEALGARRLGSGPKAHMRFDFPQAWEAMQRLEEQPVSKPRRPRQSKSRPRGQHSEQQKTRSGNPLIALPGSV